MRLVLHPLAAPPTVLSCAVLVGVEVDEEDSQREAVETLKKTPMVL